MKNTANAIKVHTISVFVANKPGVLARIAQIFARRGFNIDSLVVSPSADGRYSRMTIASQGSTEGLEQITDIRRSDCMRCQEYRGRR